MTPRESVHSAYSVSRETADKLDLFVSELARWQRIKNLVAPGELEVVWQRHVADSLQLVPLAGQGPWIDLGSGAGFPGLVAAIALPQTEFHLVESNARKAAFLRQIVRLAAGNAVVHPSRIEDVAPRLQERFGTVSARALAPLSQLLAWSESLLRNGAVGLFPKGRDHASELTQAAQCWRFASDLIPSRTDSAARIIRVHSFDGRRTE